MGRTARDHRDMPHPRPVRKIQLSEEHTRRRLIAAVLLLLIGGGALAYSFTQFISPQGGWQEIRANTSGGITCAEEFTFLYDVGSGGASAPVEGRAVISLYTEACRRAYQAFHTMEGFEGVGNLWDVNHRPNEVVTVDEVLYRAFETVQRGGERTIYLGPVYERYEDLFYCQDDSQLVDFDPYASGAVREEYAAYAAYAVDPRAVDVELLGDNRVRLHASEEYLAFAEEAGISRFLDFGWLKNAFVTDYLAQVMIENGYTHGAISSYDGFIRNLDNRGQAYALNLLDWLDSRPIQAGSMEYQGPMSLVSLRCFPANEGDGQRFYQLRDGQVRTMYLDPGDGQCRAAADFMVCYGDSLGCAEIALKAAPVYIADGLSEPALRELIDGDIRFVCLEERAFLVSDPRLMLTDLYQSGGVRYSVSYMNERTGGA